MSYEVVLGEKPIVPVDGVRLFRRLSALRLSWRLTETVYVFVLPAGAVTVIFIVLLPKLKLLLPTPLTLAPLSAAVAFTVMFVVALSTDKLYLVLLTLKLGLTVCPEILRLARSALLDGGVVEVSDLDVDAGQLMAPSLSPASSATVTVPDPTLFALTVMEKILSEPFMPETQALPKFPLLKATGKVPESAKPLTKLKLPLTLTLP